MIYDYHVHSFFSADCAVPPDSQLRQAELIGLEEICFTEHVEYDFHRGDWHADLVRYKREMKACASSVVFKTGAEVGLSCSEQRLETIKSEVEAAELDFVLVSLHELDDSDPMQETFFRGKELMQLTRKYYQTLFEKIKLFGPEYVSSVAHIDYLSKGYGKSYYFGGKVSYYDASDEMDAIFKWIIEKGKCLEINTSTWTTRDTPSLDWLERYVQLGGESVTLGSDAHSPERLGKKLIEAKAYAGQCGIKWICTFDKMRPVYHKI